MLTFLQLVHIFICIFLILLILIQAGKGHGLAGAFGSFAGGAAQNLFGARTTDVLTKITGYVAAIFFVSALFLAYMQVKESKSVLVTAKKPALVQEAKEGASEISKKISEVTEKLLKKTEDKTENEDITTTSNEINQATNQESADISNDTRAVMTETVDQDINETKQNVILEPEINEDLIESAKQDNIVESSMTETKEINEPIMEEETTIEEPIQDELSNEVITIEPIMQNTDEAIIEEPILEETKDFSASEQITTSEETTDEVK